MAKINSTIQINGIVQGVGFRPFINKLARKYELGGWIQNTNSGVVIKVDGNEENIFKFISEIRNNSPKLAIIESIDAGFSSKTEGFKSFNIIKSSADGKVNTMVSPDIAICSDCLRELRNENDRRYRYPFINCTNCGPRFSIINNVPYDRNNTSMSKFPMCESCREEYEDIENRRYHAQPDCCEKCGPSLWLEIGNEKYQGEPLAKTKELLQEGRIVAIKGIGGFHLACDPFNKEAVALLRKRKHREERPLAIMCAGADEAEKLAIISDEEKEALESPARPIVLLRKKEGLNLSYLSENGSIGIMLPYTPLHYLLLEDGCKSLVMTSANDSSLPIIYKNEEAREKLEGVADAILMHDREIVTRCDDSIMWVIDGQKYFQRRSRGYVPFPLKSKAADTENNILALGAEQKASFALAKGRYIFTSQHIGDLKNVETFDNYTGQIEHFKKLFDIEPEVIVSDMHPDYMSVVYAKEISAGKKLISVQHHHAHMATCMADNDLTGEVIGIIWDGTGYGTDGSIWGSEFLSGGYKSFEREGSIRPIKLPGGDKAVQEIGRIAVSLLEGSKIDSEKLFPEAGIIRAMLEADVNCPSSQGMGRLFDGVSAILGIRQSVSYEGQAAVLLESEAGKCDDIYPYEICEKDILIFDHEKMIQAIFKDMEDGQSRSVICAKFMNTLVDMAVGMCIKIRNRKHLERVVLSGGSFQNIYILERLTKALEKENFTVYRHSRVPANDEGISFGQIAIAACRG